MRFYTFKHIMKKHNIPQKTLYSYLCDFEKHYEYIKGKRNRVVPIWQYHSILEKIVNRAQGKKYISPRKTSIHYICSTTLSKYKRQPINTSLCIYRDDRLVIIPIKQPY
ncbi:hypothetical protein [Francisella philomiragia]|uniref:Uncharacterized protein n=1 Tax=Francisella philomiragia TaxID=28110 RepID=A0ABS1GEL6_9GAMM|nr:hypothetical protein [Francisella philomiragia]MBK2259599.1 hypothetical protein [Francisella philomiragia]MBK2303290.1 hypothetical protein [Francisella philomiragia]